MQVCELGITRERNFLNMRGFQQGSTNLSEFENLDIRIFVSARVLGSLNFYLSTEIFLAIFKGEPNFWGVCGKSSSTS